MNHPIIQAAALFFVAGAVSCKTIQTVPYRLEAPQFTAGTAVKIVLISDLHSTIHGKDQSVLIEKITREEPDLIVLTGDIVDDVAPVTGSKLLLQAIRSIAPLYYVTGNHEYMSRDIAAIRTMLRSYDVIILSDEYQKITLNGNPIIIAGIEDPYKKTNEDSSYDQQVSMEKAFAPLDKDNSYKILLAHRPENIKQYLNHPFDLILSGHTHGGQVRLFGINGLYSPNQGFFPRYGGGLYRHSGTTHIISRGLSVNRFLPRIGNPPELVVIEIHSVLTKMSGP